MRPDTMDDVLLYLYCYSKLGLSPLQKEKQMVWPFSGKNKVVVRIEPVKGHDM